MRTKIRVDNKWYRPVPWFTEGNCEGCVLDLGGCVNTPERNNPCDNGNEFTGMIFIPNTKEAIAEYVAKRLEGSDEDSVE